MTGTLIHRRPRRRARGGPLRLRALRAPGVVARPGDPGRLYVLEQAGRVRVVEGGRVLPEPFLDLTDRVESGGERGLLGLAFHPDHARNGRLFVHYSDPGGDTRVVEFTAHGDR